MAWHTTRPTPPQLVLPRPGWHAEPPPPEHLLPRPVGWWAVLALDTAVTLHWLSEVELEYVRAIGIEVLAVTASRSLALQKIGMVTMQRNLTVDRPLALQGIYLTGLSLNVALQRALTFQRIGVLSLPAALDLTPTLGLLAVPPLDVPAAWAVSSSLNLTPVRPVDVPQVLTVGRSLSLGTIQTLALNRSIALSSPLAFGFPPTAEVTDALGTAGTNSDEPYTFTIRRWSEFIDEVLLGGGGSGQASASFIVGVGDGGGAGKWATRTWVRGTELGYDLLTITGTMGRGGDGPPGPSVLTGEVGDPTVSSTGLSAAGGDPGALWGTSNGDAVPALSFNGKAYTGGARTGTGRNGPNGNWPGGGGAGSTGFGGGGSGARGRAWYRSYQ